MSFIKQNDTDNYATDKEGWENIKQYIPKDKIIWAPFYCDGKQKQYFEEMGYNIIHEDKDFFSYTPKYDLVIDNPPFSKKKEVLQRLFKLDKPFILIMPASKICTSYMRDNFKNDSRLQIIIPIKRIHFMKQIEGKVPNDYKSCCNFYCFYYCWKMNLENSITWLE